MSQTSYFILELDDLFRHISRRSLSLGGKDLKPIDGRAAWSLATTIGSAYFESEDSVEASLHQKLGF
jgi:hypothetical protein